MPLPRNAHAVAAVLLQGSTAPPVTPSRPAPRTCPGPGSPSSRPRPLVNPLPLAMAAAGAGELAGAAREAEVAKLVHGGALVASARRPGWRLPLVTMAIGLRALELTRRPPTAAGVLWLAALTGLRRELSRAEAWDSPLSR